MWQLRNTELGEASSFKAVSNQAWPLLTRLSQLLVANTTPRNSAGKEHSAPCVLELPDAKGTFTNVHITSGDSVA